MDGEASMFESGFRAPRHELIRDPAKMAAYRARWINETEPALREQRFTSSVAAGSAGSTAPGFAPSVQRFLVGVPKSVEVLRQKCVDALGSDGVLRLHVLLPPRFKRSAASMVNPLQIALRDICGVKLNIDMANELWKMLVCGARARRRERERESERESTHPRYPPTDPLPPSPARLLARAGLTRWRRTSRSAAT